MNVLNVYIGRQPIYNAAYNIAGYELLYRSGPAGAGGGQTPGAGSALDGDSMTRSVLSDAVSVFGISNLTNGLPAYINFTRNLLIDDFAYLFDPKEIVVEVPGNIYVDDTLIGKLSALQSRGYALSLNSYSDFNGRIRFNRIMGVFNVIRLDIGKHSKLQLRDLIRRLKFSRAQLLAERVENERDFELAQNLSFTLFQGYYFEKPACLSKQISLTATSYGRLFNELLRLNVNYDVCGRIIESDAVLTHMFLRRAFVANYNHSNVSGEIRRGLTKLGTEELRRWVSVVMLKQTNATNSEELPRKAYSRGRFIERLIEHSDSGLASIQGFFLGMVSLLDKVMGVTTESLLSDLNLSAAMRAALLGREENEYTPFLQYAMVYEMATGQLILPDIGLRLDNRQVSKLYMECIAESDTAFSNLEANPANLSVYQGTLIRR